jgi:hypothetical protein
MKRNPFFTTVSGREIDLVTPDIASISFEDLAHHGANICRFGGATAERDDAGRILDAGRHTYSVAQHGVLGTRLSSKRAKPYFLVHDAHEGIGGDDVTPKKKARPYHLRARLLRHFPLADVEKVLGEMRAADGAFEDTLMEAVHRAAGLQWPVPEEIEAEVKYIDRVMLLTEWHDLMPGAVPEEYRTLGAQTVEPHNMRISPWAHGQAKSEYFAACVSLLPVYQHRRG